MVWEGDQEAFDANVADASSELRAEAERRRATARVAAFDLREEPTLPLTSRQWLSWFDEHEEKFRQAMASATRKRRRINRRISSTQEEFPPAIAWNLPSHRSQLTRPSGSRCLLSRSPATFSCSPRNQRVATLWSSSPRLVSGWFGAIP